MCYLGVSVSSFFISFYSVFEVGLNTQQNSPAAHCSDKIELKSAENARRKPVYFFSIAFFIISNGQFTNSTIIFQMSVNLSHGQ